jgi:hypothetical protein
MAGNVAGQIAAGAIPAVVGLSFGLKTGVFPVEGQHPVRFESQKILFGQLLSFEEQAAGQPDFIQGNGGGAKQFLLNCPGLRISWLDKSLGEQGRKSKKADDEGKSSRGKGKEGRAAGNYIFHFTSPEILLIFSYLLVFLMCNISYFPLPRQAFYMLTTPSPLTLL